MAIDFLYPQYEVVRNNDRCINCRACERQCANEVHFWDADNNRMQADESKCVACHRCVALCPTRALKIVKTDHTFRENANWTGKAISEVYRQAGSGGVLLSSMGNPDPHPIYWDTNSHQRFAGYQSVHRPAARADGDQDLPRQKAGQD